MIHAIETEKIFLISTVLVWYIVGVFCICTTKILLMHDQYNLPPMFLTFQQLFVGSWILRGYIAIGNKRGIQPWPGSIDASLDIDTTAKKTSSSSLFAKLFSFFKNIAKKQRDFSSVDFLLLAGLFNSIDFFCGNTGFSKSSASFVETIKASEPITTTTIALLWGIDTLGFEESIALLVLFSGVFLSTIGNSEDASGVESEDQSGDATIHDMEGEELLPEIAPEPAPSLQESVITCVIVMTANICYAFRALNQKYFRSSLCNNNAESFDDVNLLFRMMQTGSTMLSIPLIICHGYELLALFLHGITTHSMDVQLRYIIMALFNAWAYATYCLAGCYLLSRISVVQCSGLGCLRRMFTIVMTSIAFKVPINLLEGVGILMSFIGFFAFNHFRFRRLGMSKKTEEHQRHDEHPSSSSIVMVESSASIDDAIDDINEDRNVVVMENGTEKKKNDTSTRRNV